jgi:hypothetical protein
VRQAFLAYLSGDQSWRSQHAWQELELKTGCLGSVLLLVGTVATAVACVS